MTTAHLRDDLKRDEGVRLTAYQDTVGVWTVGYGHAHVPPQTVWTQEQAEEWLDADIQTAASALDSALPWWRKLTDERQDVLLNMCFNMGLNGLLSFKNTLGFIQKGQYDKAADNMLKSLWARQVGKRAVRLADQMRGPAPVKQPLPVIGITTPALAAAPIAVVAANAYPWLWPFVLGLGLALAMTGFAYLIVIPHRGKHYMPVSPEFQADLDAIAKAVTDIAAHESGESSTAALQAQLDAANAALAQANTDKADTVAALNAQVAALESQVAGLTTPAAPAG